MAINKTFVHFDHKSVFDEKLVNNELLESSIVFIKDTQQIWTHGQLYNCSDPNLSDYITEAELNNLLSGITSNITNLQNNSATKTALNDLSKTVSSLQTTMSSKADLSDLDDYVTIDNFNSGLSSKQATLISGTNIKTIEGNSILGSGNIQITAEQVGTYTSSEIDDKISTLNTEIGKKATKSTTLSGYGITNAYTKTESDNKYLTKDSAGNTYATITTANTLQDDITAVDEDLQEYKTIVSNTFLDKNTAESNYVTKGTSYTKAESDAKYLVEDDLAPFATSSELNALSSTVSSVSAKVTTNTNNITSMGNRINTLEGYFATAEDTDDIINKWVDVVEFLDGMAEGNTDGEKLEAILAAKANQSALNQTNENIVAINARFSGYKPVQTAVTSPSASNENSTSFIDTIAQDVNGVISATKKTLPSASTSVKGIVQLTNSTSSTSTTTAATPNSVKSAYDLANTANTSINTISGYFENGKAKSSKVADSATTATNLADNPVLAVGTTDTDAIKVTVGNKTSSEFIVPYASKTDSANTATSATTASTANKTAKSLVVKIDNGNTEGTDKYTFNGSTDKTLNIKAGNNISLASSSGSVTIDATDIPKFYYIEGSGTTDSTAKTSNWTGSHSLITEYIPGLTIAYKIGVAGQTTTTLDINGLGAVTVVKNATTAISTAYPVNSVVILTYTLDDTTAYWKVADQTSTYSNASLGSGYATCSTTASTVAKTASLSSYSASTGGNVSVRFTNGNTVANPTLNINSKGAKKIYYKGAALTDTTLIGAGDIVTFVYSTYYYIVSILKADQTFTLTGDVTASASVDPNKDTVSLATTLSNSGVTAGNYGQADGATLSHSGTFTIPYLTVDVKGRITSASNKTITLPSQYSLPLAASGTRGGIQLGYAATGANVPVQLSSEKAYVALTKTAVTTALGYTPPTTNTTYSAATTSAEGLMSASDKTKLDGIAAGAEVNVQSDWNATSGDALILNKPTALKNPSSLTIQKNGTTVTNGTYDGSAAKTVNITVPTKVSDLTNDSGFTSNAGTVTGVAINGTTKSPTSGVVDLGTVITSLDGYATQSWVEAKGYKTTDNDTKTTAGSSNKTATKLLLVGATSTTTGTTYTNSNCYVGTDNCLYSGGAKVLTSHQDISGKQDKLVSGTNIKTVNSNSLLGSGNISVGTITKVQINGSDVASSGTANIPAASTSAYGVTKLSSATNSTSTSLAATASAVKSAYDLANGKWTYNADTIKAVKVNNAVAADSASSVAWSGVTGTPTSLSGYGITDAYTKSGANGKFISGSRSAYDVDTLYNAGIWMVASGSHVPCGSNYGVCLTMPYRQLYSNSKPDFGAQIFLPNGDDETKPNSMYFRTALADTWNAWQEVATTSMIPTYTNGTGISISSNQISLNSTYAGYCNNANTLYTFYEGSNSVTSLTNIPVTKRLCFVTVSSSASMTLASTISNGREVHIIIKNSGSADITVTMPTSSTYVHLGENFFTVPAGGYSELNIISDGSKHYTRFI